MNQFIRGLIATGIMAGFFVLVFWNVALPKDNGQWGGVPDHTRAWVKGLKNPKTGISCCDLADGHPLDESQWWIDGQGKFVVRYGGREFIIPDDRVVSVPNQLGSALLFVSDHGYVWCFIPGNLS